MSLQIRLSRVGSSSEGGGGVSKSVETVTVACPDHLVLADLPVAKSLSTITTAPLLKTVGRRSRRHLGERVHFCVRCDFPIAIYGRLSPCEHVFCLACARSDSSCYLCEERIQKIQTIKMLEGIFICAAPHCLKSFLKRSEFEAHINDIHADLLQSSTQREEGNETDTFNITRPSSSDPYAKQPVPPDSSTGRAQPRQVFSPNSNSQPHDRDDKARRHQPREPPPPPPKPLLQPRPPPFYSRQLHHPAEPLPENNPHQGFDRPYNRFSHHQSFETQGALPYPRDSDQFPDKQSGILSESSLPDYPPLHNHHPPSFPVPGNANQGLGPPPPFNYSPFPVEGPQAFYSAHHYETPRADLASDGGSEQGSLLGFPPPAAGATNFSDNFPRPWSMGLTGLPFEPLAGGQGIPEGYADPTDSQGRVGFFQGDYGRVPGGLPLNPAPLGKGLELQGGAADYKDGKGVLAPQPLLLPRPLPPPPPPPLSQLKRGGKFSSSSDAGRENQGYGWQNEKRGFGSGLD